MFGYNRSSTSLAILVFVLPYLMCAQNFTYPAGDDSQPFSKCLGDTIDAKWDADYQQINLLIWGPQLDDGYFKDIVITGCSLSLDLRCLACPFLADYCLQSARQT